LIINYYLLLNITNFMQELTSDQYGLSLHTNTPELGLTINNFQGDYRSQMWNLGRDLANNLHQYLRDFIYPQTWSNLAFITVGKGPGGFTGTRIGMVTARTMAQQLNIPIYSISNLAAIAHAHLTQNLGKEKSNHNLLAIEMKAVREQIFGGIYEADFKNLGVKCYLEDNTYTPEKWQEILNQLPQNYEKILAVDALAQTSSNMLELAYLQWQQGQFYHWSESKPFYGQHPVN
jgi:tRNA threonylcarbamoyl adenosine modification protein YeaZ